jgi:hypothetical protein
MTAEQTNTIPEQAIYDKPFSVVTVYKSGNQSVEYYATYEETTKAYHKKWQSQKKNKGVLVCQVMRYFEGRGWEPVCSFGDVPPPQAPAKLDEIESDKHKIEDPTDKKDAGKENWELRTNQPEDDLPKAIDLGADSEPIYRVVEYGRLGGYKSGYLPEQQAKSILAELRSVWSSLRAKDPTVRTPEVILERRVVLTSDSKVEQQEIIQDIAYQETEKIISIVQEGARQEVAKAAKKLLKEPGWVGGIFKLLYRMEKRTKRIEQMLPVPQKPDPHPSVEALNKSADAIRLVSEVIKAKDQEMTKWTHVESDPRNAEKGSDESDLNEKVLMWLTELKAKMRRVTAATEDANEFRDKIFNRAGRIYIGGGTKYAEALRNLEKAMDAHDAMLRKMFTPPPPEEPPPVHALHTVCPQCKGTKMVWSDGWGGAIDVPEEGPCFTCKGEGKVPVK